ncbi:glutamate-cysteine ligase family protein [Catenulispora yoronensis]
MSVGSGPRFGIEEEFLVVDRRSRAVVPRAGVVIGRAKEVLGERIGGEITKLQIEARTDPCRTVAEAVGQLEQARGCWPRRLTGTGWRWWPRGRRCSGTSCRRP